VKNDEALSNEESAVSTIGANVEHAGAGASQTAERQERYDFTSGVEAGRDLEVGEALGRLQNHLGPRT
jgi:hypothetical protein